MLRSNKYYFNIARLLLLVFLIILLASCNPQLRPATLQTIDQAEACWQAAPILNYHIIVDVQRPDEERRNDITVQQGQVTQASVSYWDAASKTWTRSTDLNQQQSFPFTVPGLFDTVRGELNASSRIDIQVDLRDNPPFLHQILLGPVQQDGQEVLGTQALVTVEQFESLP